MFCDATLIQYSSFSVRNQVRQELTEEYEQVKGIIGTLESFKSEKPVDILAPHSEERPEDPAIWPPPTPAEHRNPVAVKRPNSAVKQQRKDSPGLQHRGAVSGGRGQANPKPDRPGPRGTKAKDDKVRLQRLIGG